MSERVWCGLCSAILIYVGVFVAASMAGNGALVDAMLEVLGAGLVSGSVVGGVMMAWAAVWPGKEA